MGRVETLILLKHDLGIHTNAHDEYLRFLLKSAKERISRGRHNRIHCDTD